MDRSLTSITIPENVESIGDYAFFNADKLTSVTFSGASRLTSIGELSFKQSNLELEYLELANAKTLKPLTSSWPQLSVCCIATWCGDVRLIDNLEISR
jgi:pantoate--beta-alanine ligase